MKKTLSLDIRQRILDCYDEGKWTRADVAERFRVSIGMVKKLIQQRKNTGEIGNLYHRVGRKPDISGKERGLMAAAIEKRPDITLAELRGKLGLTCSLVTVHNTLSKMDMTYKKRPSRRASRTGKTSKPPA